MYSSVIKTLILLCLVINFTSLAHANTYDSIECNLDLINIEDSVLKVEINMRGNFKDKLVLHLPSKWADTTYIDQIKNIKVNPNFSIEIEQENDNLQAIIALPTNPNDFVKITYEIHQKAGNPSNVHEAIVRNDLVHAPGYGIFAVSCAENEIKTDKITVNWINLPSAWKTLSSYGDKSTIILNLRTDNPLHSLYLAGKVRLHNIGTDSQPVFLSLYGRFDMEDEIIASDLKKIINSQRTFFNDFDFPFYAISLIKGDNPSSMGGTCLSNSFTAYLPREMHKNDYYILFAHEHLHNWIGGKIRNNQEEELNYWFTEGFTDFYSRLIALRSNGIDKKTFIDEINFFLRSYYLSPVNQEPNIRIKEDFWNNYDINKLPYYRGLVFALYLNNIIQKENTNNSLDNVVHDLFKIAKEQPFSSTLFKDIVQRYVKNGIENEMMSFIEKGNIISLEGIALPMEKISRGSCYLGFNSNTLTSEWQIQEIDVKSEAYKAGLRNGQKVISHNCPIGKGDPDQLITITTRDGTFKFKPEHYKKVDMYQLKTNLLPQEDKQFNKFFGTH